MQEEENAANIPLAESLWASVLRTACQKLFWDIWFKIMRKPTQAVRWMERISARGREHPGTVGTGPVPGVGGRVCFPGDSALPSWEDTYCFGICRARGGQKALQKGLHASGSAEKGVPSLEQSLHWMSMKQWLQSPAFTLLLSESAGRKLYKYCI